MNAKEIRQKFLDYFDSKQHKIVDSAPMVIKDDPTLMFTNAGMNQFKDIFLGNSNPKYKRAADSQKCLRVSGKHNDLEEVGVDTYHHTMFEMLGNWSFGDYFKKEAIHWAWELLTDIYGVNKDDLYVTIFEGDNSDGLDEDKEARKYWSELVPDERIIACSKKDNFWEMGETGPCGPCSEIHVDIRCAEDKSELSGRELVNKDHPQVMEIWNLVFMEFNRKQDSTLESLPAKHVDTGLGFERLATVLQGKKSNYDTDIFSPLIEEISLLSGMIYGATASKADISFRVVSDHVRAVSFSIADGQLPSNVGAGYVIRRILRRAIRYAYSFLDLNEPFIYKLVPVLVEQMGAHFSELKRQQSLIEKVIYEEEESFLKTLGKGIKRLKEIVQRESSDVIDGSKVFELYDTFGFPEDLTALILSEQGKSLDKKSFDEELLKQKERSRAAGKIEAGDWTILIEDEVEEFIGYDKLESTVRISRYRKVKSKGKEYYQLVFNLTPFYPNGGGQVGDNGILEAEGERVEIFDTVKENNLIVHKSESLPVNPKLKFYASVNRVGRVKTALNHSATHLLHLALRKVLGDHVEQKGSLVNERHLRFDFSHFSKMKEDEIQKVEWMVNDLIRKNSPLEENRNMPIDDAKSAGAIMLFGEKYGDVVRMISLGESKELCGGTHVQATGDIGLFKIVSEGAIAAGVRRIEAITGDTALCYVNDQLQELKSSKMVLKSSNNLPLSINELLDQNGALKKEIEKFNKEKVKGLKTKLMRDVQMLDGVYFVAQKLDLNPEDIKDLAFQMKNELDNLFAVFGSENNGKALLTCVVSENLIGSKGLNAGSVVKDLAKYIQGGGGGQPFFATAGGKNVSGLEAAIKNAVNFIN